MLMVKTCYWQMGEFGMAMMVQIFLYVLFNLCFNYVWETSSPYSLSLLVFRGNTQLDHFSIRNWFWEPSAGWTNVFNDANFKRIKSLSSKLAALYIYHCKETQYVNLYR